MSTNRGRRRIATIQGSPGDRGRVDGDLQGIEDETSAGQADLGVPQLGQSAGDGRVRGADTGLDLVQERRELRAPGAQHYLPRAQNGLDRCRRRRRHRLHRLRGRRRAFIQMSPSL